MSYQSVKSQLTKLSRNQSGIAHFGLVVVLAAVISVTGFVGYNVYQRNNSSAATNATTNTAKGDITFTAKKGAVSRSIPVANSGLTLTTKVTSPKLVSKPCPKGNACAAVMTPVEEVEYFVTLQRMDNRKGIFWKKANWVDANQRVTIKTKNGEQKSHLFSGLAPAQYRVLWSTSDTAKLKGSYQLSASKFTTTTPSADSFGKEKIPTSGAKDVVSKTFTAPHGAIQVRTYFSQPKVCRTDVTYKKPCVEPATVKYDVWIEKKVGNGWQRVSAVKRGDANHKKYVRDVIPFDNAVHRDGSQYRARFSTSALLYGSFTVDTLRTNSENGNDKVKVHNNTQLQTVQPAPAGNED